MHTTRTLRPLGLKRQRFIRALSLYDINSYFTGISSRMTGLNLLYLTSHLDMKTLEHDGTSAESIRLHCQ